VSLDLYLKPEPCDKCGRSDEELNFNITYNLSEMWHEACPINQKNIMAFDGMSAKNALPVLEATLEELEKNPQKYKKLNPENGWGSYEVLLDTLTAIIIACKKHPEAVFDSWR